MISLQNRHAPAIARSELEIRDRHKVGSLVFRINMES